MTTRATASPTSASSGTWPAKAVPEPAARTIADQSAGQPLTGVWRPADALTERGLVVAVGEHDREPRYLRPVGIEVR
ncbi:hypothetical protein AB0H12_20695 [Actinosynnema sp. NPDC023794]